MGKNRYYQYIEYKKRGAVSISENLPNSYEVELRLFSGYNADAPKLCTLSFTQVDDLWKISSEKWEDRYRYER